MGKHYCQLTAQDRVFLGIMLRRGESKVKIAAVLGVHRSTIYREIKRNGSKPQQGMTDRIFYLPSKAQRKYCRRRKRLCKLLSSSSLRSYVHEKLLKGWSPWQIEGRLKYKTAGRCLISHETIYRYIYSDYGLRNRFYKKLRRQHLLRVKHHSRKTRFPKELLIWNRPGSIANRTDFGHWECDLMIFKRGIQSNLITLRERKTRYLVTIKNFNKRAKGTAMNIISTLKHIKSRIHSITFDQGSEFMRYEWIKDCLDASIYFCEPASPHQKGAIENVNGVIRSLLPRHYNLDAMNESDLASLTAEINGRPLKCLGYRTPAELFIEQIRS